MPRPAVKLGTPPAELNDRAEGWGVTGRVKGVAGTGDNGEWPVDLPPLLPSKQMYNRNFPLEHPETSDVRVVYDNGEPVAFETTWVRVISSIDIEHVHGYDEEGNPIMYVHHDREALGEDLEIVYQTDYELHQINTAITYSDYPSD